MARSNLTVAELNVAAMVLGMWYHVFDHTFNGVTEDIELDADTMELPCETYTERKQMVQDGLIGAKDYDEHTGTKNVDEPLHGEG